MKAIAELIVVFLVFGGIAAAIADIRDSEDSEKPKK